MKTRLSAFLMRPLRDLMDGLDRCLDGGVSALVWVAAGLVVGWFVYVPIHELAHAYGCLLTGGTVTALEIDPLYGGGILERVIPFVKSGSEYAGRLTGFDTGGSDLVYLVTDLAPFLLALLPGIALLLWAGSRGKAMLFGLSLPFALSPFLSLTGDAYEIGSIVTTRLPPWSRMSGLLRGDDVLRKLGEVAEVGGGVAWSGVLLATLVGTVWAFGFYALFRSLAVWLGAGEQAEPAQE